MFSTRGGSILTSSHSAPQTRTVQYTGVHKSIKQLRPHAPMPPCQSPRGRAPGYLSLELYGYVNHVHLAKVLDQQAPPRLPLAQEYITRFTNLWI